MLSETELKTIALIYRVTCKSFRIPFHWDDGKLNLKAYGRVSSLYNVISWIFILSTAFIRVYQIPATAAKREINVFIVHGFFLLHSLATVVFRKNIWIYKEDMVTLVNQELHVNLNWGEYRKVKDC
jgi:hypothetical protein